MNQRLSSISTGRKFSFFRTMCRHLEHPVNGSPLHSPAKRPSVFGSEMASGWLNILVSPDSLVFLLGQNVVFMLYTFSSCTSYVINLGGSRRESLEAV